MHRSRGSQIQLRSPDPRRFDARAVIGEGSRAPRVYLVGEAPGREEAESGRPFVGPAGTALREMMREAGMNEAQIRLANALPFRPIKRSTTRGLRNRKPTNKELRAYGPIVLADIACVRPKLIIALGTSAASLFGISTTIDRARKQVFWLNGIPVRVTYHPGYVLRFGGRGSKLWRTAVRDLRNYSKPERGSSSPSSSPAAMKGARVAECICRWPRPVRS
ncbi:MAG: uracil-DNA glycosylase [Proteobacteria bacterium]|nr:uracil-DNA glycosylase [Pseudomonadota bacterium]